MNSIQLYKFITDNCLEWRWTNNEQEDDVILFLPFSSLGGFSIVTEWSDDEPYPCVLKSNYIALFLKNICEYHGLDIEDIFDKQGSHH